MSNISKEYFILNANNKTTYSSITAGLIYLILIQRKLSWIALFGALNSSRRPEP